MKSVIIKDRQDATAWYGKLTAIFPKRDGANCFTQSQTVVQEQSGIQTGDVLAGRYRIEQSLGAGGLATVRAAWDLSLSRRVAVKLYSNSVAGGISSDEASLQAACQHPNLMPLYDAGCDSRLGVSYIVMPLYPGADLGVTISRNGPLSFRPAVLCADQVCSALDHLWRKRQTIHGDIKPSNIWLTQSGAALLMDFNLPGLLTRSEAACAGTPGFIAPEVFKGQRDQSSDVFAIGCVLYQCLTGVAPFADNQSVVSGSYVPMRRLRPDVWPELEAVVQTALQADPSLRYQTAREMQTALRRRGNVLGISWFEAVWRGFAACASLVFRGIAWLYRMFWKHLCRFARHAWRRPLQALIEAVVLTLLSLMAWRWAEAHRQEIIEGLVGTGVLAMLYASISAKLRHGRPMSRGRRR